MPTFLEQIRELDTSIPQPVESRIEPRRVRRQKARDAAKSPKLANPPAAKKAC